MIGKQQTIVLPPSAAPELPKQGERYRIVMVAALVTINGVIGKVSLNVNDGAGNTLAAFWSVVITPSGQITWAACAPSTMTEANIGGTFDPVTGTVSEIITVEPTDANRQVVSIPCDLVIETAWQPLLIANPGSANDVIESAWTIEQLPTFRDETDQRSRQPGR